jgi:hypothetical protein
MGGGERWAVLACWEQGGTLSWPSLSGDRMTQLLSGEISNIFDHIGETGSSWKLIDQKTPFQLALWIEGTGDCSQTSSWQDAFGEPAHTKESLGSPWTNSTQICPVGRGNMYCHIALHTKLKKGQRHWESPDKRVSKWTLNQRKEFRASVNWSFFCLFSIFILLSLFLTLFLLHFFHF